MGISLGMGETEQLNRAYAKAKNEYLSHPLVEKIEVCKQNGQFFLDIKTKPPFLIGVPSTIENIPTRVYHRSLYEA